MFGFVVASPAGLTELEEEHYRACYCGLCSTIGKRHGQLCRLSVNYDMTFLAIVLSSVYDESFSTAAGRCVMHPFSGCEKRTNSFTDYAADMSILLAYYKMKDDWEDDRKYAALLASGMLERVCRGISRQYAGKCAAIKAGLEKLAAVEKAGETNPDIPANLFASVMAEVFDCGMGHQEVIRGFGSSLGKFIYIMDAVIDLHKDIKSESYNPLVSTPSEEFSPLLNMLMADCMDKYGKLPAKRDEGIIGNILYSGIWTEYELHKKRTEGRQGR